MNVIETMVKTSVDALEDKKGEDIKIIDISEVSPVADCFILASGSNRSQVQAMADAVAEKMHKAGFGMKQIEGYDGANWILMDFVDTDLVIQNTHKKSLCEIIEAEGLAAFKEIENRALATLTANNCVIATGGGTVTRPENRDPLRQNGILFHLDLRHCFSEKISQARTIFPRLHSFGKCDQTRQYQFADDVFDFA